MLFLISIITSLFISVDIILKKFNIEGRYYLNHFIGNMMIVNYTFPYLISSYTDNIIEDTNMIENAIAIVYSIHIYHMIWYFSKLRYDDWLHHLLMVGVSLPLTIVASNNNLTGHCLFFITGLPGGIDYMLLFLIRNNIMDKMIEKKINRVINLWVRCPGCIATSTLIIYNIVKYYHTLTFAMLMASLIITGTVYWNGIYFMEQVVVNYALTR